MNDEDLKLARPLRDDHASIPSRVTVQEGVRPHRASRRHFSIRVGQDTLDELEARAKGEGRTPSDLARWLIANGLARLRAQERLTADAMAELSLLSRRG